MSQPLPVADFAWMNEEELQNWKRFVDEEGKGCILEVDLLYPRELHDLHNDFPLAPENSGAGQDGKTDAKSERQERHGFLHGRKTWSKFFPWG